MKPNVYVVTFGNPALVRAMGALDAQSLVREKERLLAAIARSMLRDSTIVGALDFALIVPPKNLDGTRVPYWRPHCHWAVISELSAEEVTAAIQTIRGGRAGETLDDDDYRPVVTDEFNDPFEQTSYLLKAVFWRYERYVDRHGNRRSNKLPLRPKQHRELALVLHELGPEQRLFLRRVKIVNGQFQDTHSGSLSAPSKSRCRR